MSEHGHNPYQAPLDSSFTAAPKRLTLIEVGVVISITALLMSLLLPFVQRTPRNMGAGPTRATNLRQIVLALHGYHASFGTFPPAFIRTETGRPAHSWRVLILPWLDQQALYDRYQFDEPWNGPCNIQLQDCMPACFRLPGLTDCDQESPEGRQLNRTSNYTVVSATGGVFDGDRATSFRDLEDVWSQTLLVTEVRQQTIHWMSPDDITPTELLAELWTAEDEIGTTKIAGARMAQADGSIHVLPHNTTHSELLALINASDDR